MSRMGICGLAGVVLLLSVLSAGATDTIVVKRKGTFTGTFESYKSGRFVFTPVTGKAIHEDYTQVESLVLDPPSHATVKERGKSKGEGYTLKAFQGGKFILVTGGTEKQFSPMNITMIELAFDPNRTVQSDPFTVISKGEEVVIEEKLPAETATVVQFYMADSVGSMRQGSYVASRVKDQKGKLAMLRIDMPAWECPVAKQYSITSVPQFWFYGRDGKLVTKLVDRFTDADIDKAIEQAKKVPPAVKAPEKQPQGQNPTPQPPSRLP